MVAFSTNLSFPIWIGLAERGGTSLPFTLRAVRAIDRWATIPAYLLTAASGIALTALDGIPFSATWIAGSLALFALFIGLGFVAYRPVSRERLRAAARGAAGPAYARAARAAAVLDAVIIGSALAIFALMLLRPP